MHATSFSYSSLHFEGPPSIQKKVTLFEVVHTVCGWASSRLGPCPSRQLYRYVINPANITMLTGLSSGPAIAVINACIDTFIQ